MNERRDAGPLIQVQDLTTEFSSRDGVVRAVDGVSFHIMAGETLGLVGESGSGKSVTALSLMRLLPAPAGRVTGGSVTFDGADLLSLPDREVRRIRGNMLAMVFQDPMTSLNPVLRVGTQISEALRLHLGMMASEAVERTVELLELVGIPSPVDRVSQYPHQFSGGMRQRVMIAMALACNPKLVICDEITTALDVTIQAQVLDILRQIKAVHNTGFLIITHDLGIVADMADRVHVMYAGQIVEKADTRELFADPRMPYTWGLLRSIPHVDARRGDRLTPIEGAPPDLGSIPPGCRFEPRCSYRRPICRERTPQLLPVPSVGLTHDVRCWGMQDVPGGGWLTETDWRVDLGDEAVRRAIQKAAARVDGASDVPASDTQPEDDHGE